MERLLLYTFLVLTSLAAHAQVSKRSHPLSIKRTQHTASRQAISPSVPETQGKIAQFGFARSAGFSWNGTQWANFDTTQYVYLNGRLRSETKSFFGFPLVRTFYSYDAAGRQTGVTNQGWTGTTWQNETRDTLVFNANGDLILEVSLEWDLTSSLWDSVYRESYVRTYNASNQPLLELIYYKDFGTSVETAERNQYFYSSGRVTGFTYSFFDTLSSNFEKVDSTLISYGSNNQCNQITSFGFFLNIVISEGRNTNITWNLWNGDVFSSLPASYNTQEYNGTSFLTTSTITIQYFSFGTTLTTEDYVDPLTNDERYWEYYDQQFNSRGLKFEERTGSTWSITGQDSTSITYDAQNRITETVSIYWDIFNNQLTNLSRIVYFGNYTQILGTEDQIIPTIELSIYPNPAQEFLHLKTETEVVSLNVFDAQGRKVLQSGSTQSVDISSLKSGLYAVIVETPTGIRNLKFIKE